MARTVFDLDNLRSLVFGVELGSLTRAADRLGRSVSAVSAQIKKLEEQAGTPLFRRAGRGLLPTEAGEILVSHARRLLALNDEAAVAVQGTAIAGRVRVGIQEDGGDTLLPLALGRFARAHPNVRIEARVARNADLLDWVARGQLDLALAWSDTATSPHMTEIATLPVRWIGSDPLAPWFPNAAEAMRLVAFDAACWFRATGTAALDRADRPWRVTVTSSSLSGVWAGVSAGLGLTIRTHLGVPSGLRVFEDGEYGLPRLGSVRLVLHRKTADLDPQAERLADILTDEVRSLLNRASAS